MIEEVLVSKLGEIQELDCGNCGRKTRQRFVSNITSMGAETRSQQWRFYGWECSDCRRRTEVARVPETINRQLGPGPARKGND
jgi:hypothetical protein